MFKRRVNVIITYSIATVFIFVVVVSTINSDIKYIKWPTQWRNTIRIEQWNSINLWTTNDWSITQFISNNLNKNERKIVQQHMNEYHRNSDLLTEHAQKQFFENKLWYVSIQQDFSNKQIENFQQLSLKLRPFIDNNKIDRYNLFVMNYIDLYKRISSIHPNV